MPEPGELQVIDDERDFYGRGYYESHLINDYGYPGLKQRARSDLTDRCLHWLRTVLKYKLPPGKALELGSAHSGFVALLRWAGYDATGLELSPWVVDFARKAFDVPMLLGPIEDQPLEPGSLDIIALMDVLEHLPDPISTMRRCLELLKPDGILVIQTPRYLEGKTYEELSNANDPFLQQLKAAEHLYLFSQSSIREFFRRLGADDLAFEPAMFAFYDMFAVVSGTPLTAYSDEQTDRALTTKPTSRIIQALLDLEARFRHVHQQYVNAESNGKAQHDSIDELTRLLQESDADRIARLDSINQLTRLLQESEADRAARLGIINQLTRLLQESEVDRAARLDSINELTHLLQESEADRAARLDSINKLTRLLQESNADRMAQRQTIDHQALQLEQQRRDYDELQSDFASQTNVVTEQRIRLEEIRAERDRLFNESGYYRWQWAVVEPMLRGLRASRVYLLMRRMGRWQWLEQALLQVIPVDPTSPAKHSAGDRAEGQLKRVVVDLTPVLPGGENGGAKLVALGLVQYLAQLEPSCEWVVLTTAANHEELSSLDAPNVRRMCVTNNSGSSSRQLGRWMQARTWLRDRLAAILSPRAMTRVRSLYRRVFHRPVTSSLPKQIGADLVFCPFTAPLFFDPSVPTVIVVHDLQYRYYPQFFTADERYFRDRDFRESCRVATHLVCVSDYVRETVLQSNTIGPERVSTIHTRLFHRLAQAADLTVEQVLQRFGLRADRYLLYPANFWRHKNHEMLFTAFGIYRSRNPRSNLKLVCTGAPSERLDLLQEFAHRMGLEAHVVFPGYVADDIFAALLQGCRAVIFPSLFEGFGLPLLEAFASGKPVLCSRATSLPEIAGDAALMFDPRKPMEIADAIETIENQPEVATQLKNAGLQQLMLFGEPTIMAEQYLRIFHEAVGAAQPFHAGIQGIYADGWTSECVVAMYGDCAVPRHLEALLIAPAWLPHNHVSISMTYQDGKPLMRFTVARGQSLTIRQALPQKSGLIEIQVEPTFEPSACQMGDDQRSLGCMYEAFRIISPRGTIELGERMV